MNVPFAEKLKTSRNIYIHILIVPLVIAIIGTFLLFLVAQIPNELLWDNAFESGLDLLDETKQHEMFGGEGYHSLAGKRPFGPDTTTDTEIIAQSYTLGEEGNLFLKRSTSGGGPAANFIEYLEGSREMGEPYSRYWMGFRVTVRPLLLLGHYYEIREWAGILTSFLLVLTVGLLSRKNSVMAALAMAVSFGMVEPYAVCSSLQFSCCFILAFLFSCCAISGTITLDDKRCIILFCAFGALTQFFDFYTYPLITCAMPLLILISRYEGSDVLALSLRLAAVWLASWLMMWVINLVFVSVFTEENAFAKAWSSVAFRFGVGSARERRPETYSAVSALSKVWYYRTQLPIKITVPAIGLAVAGLFAYGCRRGCFKTRLISYLVVAALPVIWIIATANPINIHYFFQYRVLYVTYFALILFALEAAGFMNRRNKGA